MQNHSDKFSTFNYNGAQCATTAVVGLSLLTRYQKEGLLSVVHVWIVLY